MEVESEMTKLLTTCAVAREAGVSERRVRAYADAGIVDCVRDSANRRMFSADAPARVRAAFKQRTKRILGT